MMKKLSRRHALNLITSGAVGAALPQFGCGEDTGGEPETSRPPNIIYVMADDLGWAELGCYGNRFNETPHLDRLASQGMRFTDTYAAAPVCSPMRAGLMTGQYPARVGITDYPASVSAVGCAPTNAAAGSSSRRADPSPP